VMGRAIGANAWRVQHHDQAGRTIRPWTMSGTAGDRRLLELWR
jgi:hypothetical protein